MPPTSSWLLRLPEIAEQLKVIDIPVVDRAICERLFDVSRRRAIDLMRQFGGYRTGNTVLVDRSSLISSLEAMMATDEYAHEQKRKVTLTAKLDELHRNRAAARIRLPVPAAAMGRTVDHFPKGMVFTSGKLIVEFTTAEELFAKLYQLAQVAATNFDDFCDAIGSSNTSEATNR